MKILGISAYYHDSAAALLVDGQVVAAVQEERFSRIKQDAAFPRQSIEYCLEAGQIQWSELDAIVFYEKPFLKFERLLETFYQSAPRGWRHFLKAMPVWLKEKLFLKRALRKSLNEIAPLDQPKKLLLFPEHHLSHAASAFYPSGFSEAAILTIDGVGEWATTSLAYGNGRSIKVLQEIHFPNSIGLLYSAFTHFLGFKSNRDEYKIMGLAPYADPQSAAVQSYIQKIKNELIDLKPDGSFVLHPSYFKSGWENIVTERWEKLFACSRRKPESSIEPQHYQIAQAIQSVTEEVVIGLAKTLKELTNCSCLCLAGGVALNATANGRLQELGLYDQIFVQPAAGDAGGALGAALAAHHLYFEQERKVEEQTLKHVYLGPKVAATEVDRLWEKHPQHKLTVKDSAERSKTLARLIAAGKVVGWIQGRMEFGPRALGNRSILADPRKTEMQAILNLKIKKRESFRPFAPAVLEEDFGQYFVGPGVAPFMVFIYPLQKAIRLEIEAKQSDLLLDRLQQKRSLIPAVTHVNYTARAQTVSATQNPPFRQLLRSFKDLTGHGVLINTSFNRRGEPIVCTAREAYQCFLDTEMDVLVMGNKIFFKETPQKS